MERERLMWRGRIAPRSLDRDVAISNFPSLVVFDASFCSVEISEDKILCSAVDGYPRASQSMFQGLLLRSMLLYINHAKDNDCPPHERR